MEKIHDRNEARQRAAALRAGLIAAATYNVHRKRGTRMIRPTDFVRTKPRELTPEQIRHQLIGWARSLNAEQEN